MNFKEAIQAAIDGKTIKSISNCEYQFNKSGALVYSCGSSIVPPLTDKEIESPWTIVNEQKTVTLYRYTYKGYAENIGQTSWTSNSWSDIKGSKDVLLRTEKKEVEI
jgi:hypothetical protein